MLLGVWMGGWEREEDVLMKRAGTLKVMEMFCISTASLSTSCLRFALFFCNVLTTAGG